MPKRVLLPISYRGLGLNTLGRQAGLVYSSGAFDSPRHDPVQVARTGKFPSSLRLQPTSKVFPVEFTILSPASQQQFDALAEIFDPTLGEQMLIVEDLLCPLPSRRRRRLQCSPQQLIVEQDHDRSVVVPLHAATPILEDDTLSAGTDSIDGATNPITLTLLNGGSYRALPVFTATARQIKTAAQGFTRMSEIGYANRSEFSLTGPGSGTWLLEVTGGGWDTAAIIGQFDPAVDGRDIAVFVDEVEVPREKVTVDGFDTATTKVWIEIADGPARHAELAAAIVAGTTTFPFLTRDHGFLAGDYLIWLNGAAAFEQARISSVDGADVTVERSVRNTTAGAAAAGTSLYRSGHHIQLAWGKTGLPARPTNPDPPLIDTDVSTNLSWFWPTGPFWPDNNRRPGGWRRILYAGRDTVPELRRNRLAAKTALDVSAGDVRFADVEPTVARPNFDAIEFIACCGIDDVLGAVEYDASLGWPFCLQVIGRDLLGLDTVIFNRLGHEVGAAHFPPRIYTNQQETPSAIMSSLILRARDIVLTTARPDDSTEEVLVGLLTSGHDLQGFHIDEEAQIIGMVCRARDVSGNAGLQTQINEVGSGSITLGGTPGASAPGDRLAGPFSGAGGLGAVFLEACFFPTPAAAFTTDTPVLLPGDYFLSMAEITPGAGQINVPRSDGSIYAHGSHWEHDGSSFVRFADEDLWFSLLSLNADNQEETLQTTRSGEALLINDVTLIFDPARTPIVDVRPAENAYEYDTEWARGTDLITLRYLKRSADALNNSIEIDVGAQTVTDLENGDLIRSAVTAPSDPWLELRPGNNTLTVEAPNGAVEEEHLVEYRSAWLA